MALANINFEEIKKRIYDAYEKEDPILQKFRAYAKTLASNVKQIRPYSVNAVSFVSTDGGDNRLFFNPAVIELVRVVDSRGNECALDAIASNTQKEDLNERVKVDSPLLVEPLKRLCDDLDTKVLNLSYLLDSLGKAGKSTGAIRCYRDIVEWAVLYDLINNPAIQWGSDTIIVRDGLLRTKSFKRQIFPELYNKIKDGVQKHENKNVALSIVGVAKQSAVLSRLSIAIELEGVFNKPYPCYVKVPNEIEEACYFYDRTWLDTYESIIEYNENLPDGKKEKELLFQSMGKMYLVKFGNRPLDPVWPVDVAEWQEKNVDKILGQLTVDAQMGFPIPDYPMCIQKAHDYAKIGGIEISVLQDLLLNGIIKNLTKEETEKIFRLKYIGENLANLRYKNG